jgi:hypothetical protein
MCDIKRELAWVGDVEGKDVETLTCMVPIWRSEFFGSPKDDMEGVRARELSMEGVVR